NELTRLDDVANRRLLSDDMDKLLKTIRSLNGFEQFLLAPTESKLKELAEFGPIVVFNVSEIRSDAVIVKKDDIQVVALPSLTPKESEVYTELFLTAIRDAVGTI